MQEKQINWSMMGSSYIPALIGDPDIWITPIEVWLCMIKKQTILTKQINNRILAGTYNEPGITKSWCDQYGIELVSNPKLIHPNGLYRDTPDGMNVDRNIVFEAKNVDNDQRYKWINGTVPKYVFAQSQWHIYIPNELIELGILLKSDNKKPELFKECHVRAMFGGNEYQDFIVPRDDEFIKNLLVVVNDFIDTYVKPSRKILEQNPNAELNELTPPPPDCSERYTEFLLAKYPEHIKEEHIIIEADEKINKYAEKFIKIKKSVSKLEQKLTFLKNNFIDFIGKNYGVHTDYGNFSNYNCKGSVSWKEVALALIEKYKTTQQEVVKLIKDNTGKSYRKFNPPKIK